MLSLVSFQEEEATCYEWGYVGGRGGIHLPTKKYWCVMVEGAAISTCEMQMWPGPGSAVHGQHADELIECPGGYTVLLACCCCIHDAAASFPLLVGSGPFSGEWEGDFKQTALKSPIVNSHMFLRRQSKSETPRFCFSGVHISGNSSC